MQKALSLQYVGRQLHNPEGETNGRLDCRDNTVARITPTCGPLCVSN
jgi:hypothetical protein